MQRSIILRKLMEDRNLKVSDISKTSGIAYSTVKSIFENGTEKASYINICKICSSLGITPDELEEIAKGNLSIPSPISANDSSLLEKYHALDPSGQEHVNIVLDWEAARVQQLTELRSRLAAIVEFPQDSASDLVLNAAHEDETCTPEERRAGDSIMMDDSEWE